MYIGLGLFVLVLSWWFTKLVRAYALRENLLDIPNQRSSHKLPTPRSGGVAIVVTFLGGMIMMLPLSGINSNIIIAFIGAGICVSMIGLIDDYNHVPLILRLLVHFFAAGWTLYWLGIPAFLKIVILGVDFTLAGYIVAATILVWLLNLFNFMDGIDGLAGSEAIFIASCGLIFAIMEGHNSLQIVAGLLICSTLGFLVWNWPPAKIFMGDVGSGFLGVTLGIYAYWAMAENVVTIWTWIIVTGVFLVDATFTLVRRFFQGCNWYEAHRTSTQPGGGAILE